MITEPEASWEADDGGAGGSGPGDDGQGGGGWSTGGWSDGGRSGRRAPVPGPRSEVLAGLPPRPSRLRRLPGWLWGVLAGVLATSLAGASLAFAGALPQRHHGPDLHGYRLGQSPCAGHVFDAFGAAVRSADGAPWPAVFEHTPELDRARCGFVAQGAGSQGSKTSYDIQVDVLLHHRTDPAAEFEAERSVDPSNLEVATRSRAVPGLGDEAYLLTFDDPLRILEVRSGGAVIVLRLGAATTPYGTGPDTEQPDLPDLDRLTPPLVDAARAIMAGMAS